MPTRREQLQLLKLTTMSSQHLVNETLFTMFSKIRPWSERLYKSFATGLRHKESDKILQISRVTVMESEPVKMKS